MQTLAQPTVQRRTALQTNREETKAESLKSRNGGAGRMREEMEVTALASLKEPLKPNVLVLPHFLPRDLRRKSISVQNSTN